MQQSYCNYLLLSLLFFGAGQVSNAQKTIIGKVQNTTGEPVAFANVLLLSASDSALVKGTLTDDHGAFIFGNITKGKYSISASLLGYKPNSSDPFEFDGSSQMVLPPINLTEGVELDEATLTSTKNLYVQKIDRMVINLASSILSAGSSALEILERSPGVLVDRQNSTISLMGKSGVIVMIDGKQTYMPASSLVQLLQSMNANNIETIELITTPPANFDAEGNAGFINIVLKERTDFGLNGSYSLSFGTGNGSTTSDNINFNFRKNKVNLFGSYSFQRDAQGQLFEFDRNFFDGNENSIAITTKSNRDPVQRNHTIRMGLDYQVSDKTAIGLLLWGNDNKWTMDAINQSRESENEVPRAFVELLNTERNQLAHLGSNFNIKHDFKEDAYISMDFGYLKYRFENPTVYRNRFFDGTKALLREELTQSDKTTPINLTVGKLDYSSKISD